jgi:hypothetical protein
MLNHFEENRDRLNYPELWFQHLPIDNGQVESSLVTLCSSG